ncbi:MAG: hypothetical protein SO147_04185 [Clostridia bacterium]|nr:hypothetical protein [Clostridia bacterium]
MNLLVFFIYPVQNTENYSPTAHLFLLKKEETQLFCKMKRKGSWFGV